MKRLNLRSVRLAENSSSTLPLSPRDPPFSADKIAAGQILSWAEVKSIHRTRNGIYHRAGRLISLLTDFGRLNPCYPDRLDESSEVIYYTGEGRSGDQRLSPGNRALLAAIETGHAVPLFNKLGVGHWQCMGQWRVANGEHRFDKHENRMLWWFTLERAGSDNL